MQLEMDGRDKRRRRKKRKRKKKKRFGFKDGRREMGVGSVLSRKKKHAPGNRKIKCQVNQLFRYTRSHLKHTYSQKMTIVVEKVPRKSKETKKDKDVKITTKTFAYKKSQGFQSVFFLFLFFFLFSFFFFFFLLLVFVPFFFFYPFPTTPLLLLLLPPFPPLAPPPPLPPLLPPVPVPALAPAPAPVAPELLRPISSLTGGR